VNFKRRQTPQIPNSTAVLRAAIQSKKNAM